MNTHHYYEITATYERTSRKGRVITDSETVRTIGKQRATDWANVLIRKHNLQGEQRAVVIRRLSKTK